MMPQLMQMKILDNPNRSRRPHTSDHIQQSISYFIKSSTFFMWIKLHTLDISRFAWQDRTDNVGAFY